MESSARGSRVGGGGAGAEALPLPPPPRLAAVSSSPASIRALLARTASGNGVADCQSPRSLLSRILQRGDGGNGGFGCRVRLPRRYSSSGSGGGGREERKGGVEQAAAAPWVKVVERAPELPVETPRSSVGKKKPEEELMTMNLGLAASLVLLLSKSAVDLNKMVELRAQMEALVSEIRKETTQRKKDSASSSSQESNGSTTTTTIKDPIACPAAEDVMSNCSRTAVCAARDNLVPGRTGVVMDQMEAELQVELNRLQCAVHGEKGITPIQGLELPLRQNKTKSNVSDSPSRSCVDDDGAKDDDDDDDVAEGNAEEEEAGEEEQGYDVEKSPPHGGVSARALERRLHELLQKRQQERIVELESALDSAQRRLHEKEREVVWWRDAAKLVSHRRDEPRRLR